MPHVVGEIVINRPVEQVFDFVADERNEPRFNPKMLTVEKVTPGPGNLVPHASQGAAADRGDERGAHRVRQTQATHVSQRVVEYGDRGDADVRPRSRGNAHALVMGSRSPWNPQAGDAGHRPHRAASRADDLDEPEASSRTGHAARATFLRLAQAVLASPALAANRHLASRSAGPRPQ